VAPEELERAVAALAGVPAVERIEPAEGQAGWLSVELAAPRGHANGAPGPNEPIRALLDAAITVRAFELDGTRLSDAFLAMTEAS
jgi:ABC-2 type transport system ATP-binding protein